MTILASELPNFSFFDVYLVYVKTDDKIDFFGIWSTLEEARHEAVRRENSFIVRFGLDGGVDDFSYEQW